MVEVKNSYHDLEIKEWPDIYVISLLNTLADQNKLDPRFIKRRSDIKMVIAGGNKTDPERGDLTDPEIGERKLIFIVPNPAVLLKMTTGEALKLMKKRVDEFMLQLRKSEKN